MKRFIALLLVVALMATLLVGCGGKEEPAPQPKQEAVQFVWADRGTTDIITSPWREILNFYVQMLFEPLVSVNGDGTVVNRLAEDVEVSEDGLTYTFTITDKATWTDGEPVTAEDVEFSLWGMLAAAKSSYGARIFSIKGAAETADTGVALEGVKVDGNKVIVTLEKPNMDFLQGIANVMILPKHLLGDLDRTDINTNEEFWTNPVGCGAFKIETVSAPDYFTVVANETYYREQPGFDKAVFTSYVSGGPDAVYAAMISGTIDIVDGGSYNDIAAAEGAQAQNAGLSIIQKVSTYGRQLLFNYNPSQDGGNHPGVADAKVRRAIELAIDKAAVAEVYGSNTYAISTFVHPDSEMFNTDIGEFVRDVETAKAMLDEAGFDYDQPIRIAYYYDNQITKDAMAIITANLAEVGIKVDSFLLTGDLGAEIYEFRNYDILLCGEAMADPVTLYGVLLGTRDGSDYFTKNTAAGWAGQLGDIELRQQLFTDLIEQYEAATSKEERKEIADQLQLNNIDYVGLIPLVGINTLTVYNTDHIEIPEEVLKYDCATRDWQFENWKLVG